MSTISRKASPVHLLYIRAVVVYSSLMSPRKFDKKQNNIFWTVIGFGVACIIAGLLGIAAVYGVAAAIPFIMGVGVLSVCGALISLAD